VSEQAQNPQQQTQEDRYLQEAQSFFGQSMGRVRSQVQNYHEQLERYAEQAPAGSDAEALIQEMVEYYSEIEDTMERAAQDAGAEDEMNQAAEQTNQQMQQVAEGAVRQAEDASQNGAAGQAQGQAQQEQQQEPPNATQAAENKAQELGVDLSRVEGSGAQGRITVGDVIGAAGQ
jgi:pyruvate/2-oxoglutarate dehydrogenase complex dihydrolipoamide acyltransferase (E2) component